MDDLHVGDKVLFTNGVIRVYGELLSKDSGYWAFRVLRDLNGNAAEGTVMSGWVSSRFTKQIGFCGSCSELVFALDYLCEECRSDYEFRTR